MISGDLLQKVFAYGAIMVVVESKRRIGGAVARDIGTAQSKSRAPTILSHCFLIEPHQYPVKPIQSLQGTILHLSVIENKTKIT